MSDTSINSVWTTHSPQPSHVNYVHLGTGAPVILLHGIAASLHDWDELIPDLVINQYAAYALDLLGHGESAKPDSRNYHVDWLFGHLVEWIASLDLNERIVLIGHFLGAYLALEYARRFPAHTRGLILSSPFYKVEQLSALLRFSYRRPALNSIIVERIPQWLFRAIIDATSLSLGRKEGTTYNLPEMFVIRLPWIISVPRRVYIISPMPLQIFHLICQISISPLWLFGEIAI